jgi:isoquinoline 1-oxidoreductase beta subunit
VLVAWRVWPREERAGLPTAEGETAFGGWIKIGQDGHIVVAVPQLEYGQGVYTALPQIVADELGADWRTVGVEAAPLSALYGAPLAAEAIFGGDDAITGTLGKSAPMLTGAATSIRQFEAPLRTAAAATRALLCKAATRRWGGDWESCTTDAGFVVLGSRRARFGELAADAANESLPSAPGRRMGDSGRLTGRAVPRLDAPAKVDGTINFAGDVRLSNMVFAAIRQGPAGAGPARLSRVDTAAADRIPGVLQVVQTDGWVAAIASSWWAANRALGEMHPRFETPGPLVDDAGIARRLDEALAAPGARIVGDGDLSPVFASTRVYRGTYRAAAGVSAAIEPVTATADFSGGKLTLWLASQAPGLARAAAARAAGLDPAQVVLHPMVAGGPFGAGLDVTVAEQAALLARRLERPVQLTWSLAESLMHAPVRAPALGRLTAKLAANGTVAGWHAAIATPAFGQAARARLPGRSWLGNGDGDAVAVDGAAPIYRVPAWGVDHHAADIGIRSGWTRGGAQVATTFFTESFVDELARIAQSEPLSYRIAMLGGSPRLARCLSTVAALGGWQGGVPGSGQGIAALAMRGSFIALMVEGSLGDGGVPKVERMVAAVDVGRAINPDLVLQSIVCGLVYGLAAAVGASMGFSGGLGDARSFRDLALPRLGTTPDITVELIQSDAPPGGASDLAVPVVAPALANAIYAATGRRIRTLPL